MAAVVLHRIIIFCCACIVSASFVSELDGVCQSQFVGVTWLLLRESVWELVEFVS